MTKKQKACKPTAAKGWKEKEKQDKTTSHALSASYLFTANTIALSVGSRSPCSRGVLAPTDLISVIKDLYSNKITSQKRAKCRDLEPTRWTCIVSNTGASFNGFPLCSSCMFFWVPTSGIDSIYLPNVFFLLPSHRSLCPECSQEGHWMTPNIPRECRETPFYLMAK